jgi:hypothetical protein
MENFPAILKHTHQSINGLYESSCSKKIEKLKQSSNTNKEIGKLKYHFWKKNKDKKVIETEQFDNLEALFKSDAEKKEKK